MTPTKLRDRRMIRHPHRRDHLVRDVLLARPLDRPRGAVPTRVRVQQERHHHPPGHTPRDPAHSPGRWHRSRPGRPSPQPPAPPTRDGRPAPNRPTTAASTTPARDHTRRSSGPSRNRHKPAGQHPLKPTASGGSRSDGTTESGARISSGGAGALRGSIDTPVWSLVRVSANPPVGRRTRHGAVVLEGQPVVSARLPAGRAAPRCGRSRLVSGRADRPEARLGTDWGGKRHDRE